MPNERKHPVFPTAAEAHVHPEQVYSDHALILAKVSVPSHDDPSVMMDEPLSILSLNTLGPNACSGLNADGADWETDEGSKQRYARIAAGLKNAVGKHDVDVIALQETHPDFMEGPLQAALGDGWVIISVPEAGMMTCYNQEKFTLDEPIFNEPQRIHTLDLTRDSDEILCRVMNVWGIYNPFPHQMEQQFKEKLQEGLEGNINVSVLIGDTNSRFALPAHENPQNITTGLIPAAFRDGEAQEADFPDGGYYCHRDGEGRFGFHQLDIETLDFATGEMCYDNRIGLGGAPSAFRMIQSLDDRYAQRTIMGGRTQSEYEAMLKGSQGLADPAVFFAANSHNEKAVAIRFAPNSALYQAIQEEYEKRPDDSPLRFQLTQILDTDPGSPGHTYPCIFAPLDQANRLHQIIQVGLVKIQVDNYKSALSKAGLSFEDEKDHATIADNLAKIFADLNSVEAIDAFFKAVGIGNGKFAGAEPDLARLRQRRKLSLFSWSHRETNDSQVIAEAGIARAKELFQANEYKVYSKEEDQAYGNIFFCQIERNKKRDYTDFNNYCNTHEPQYAVEVAEDEFGEDWLPMPE